jgi:hypothetical protein
MVQHLIDMVRLHGGPLNTLTIIAQFAQFNAHLIVNGCTQLLYTVSYSYYTLSRLPRQ